jgi:SAM-dependent methyltransferase
MPLSLRLRNLAGSGPGACQSGPVPAIDYTGAAAAFRRRRTLPPAVLDAWARVVRPRLAGAAAVLDVGAGTGQFCGSLARWAGGRVVAVEPSAAMRAELVAHAGAEAEVVTARAEALPLAASTMDAAWLSTVIHQFDDRAAALAELRRVVRPGGTVLVRGFLADQGPIGLGRFFPGIERSVARFPTTDAVVRAFADHGFGLVDVIDVEEAWTADLDAWVDALAEIRHADSMLAPLTDDEVAAGAAAVRAEAARRPGLRTVPVPLRLVTLR